MVKSKTHIFLDIDGVLATSRQYNTPNHPNYNYYPYDNECVEVFNDTVKTINPIIILSSDWKRKFTLYDMNNIFKWNGLKCKITDTTRNLWGYKYFELNELKECRAMEILEYVDDYKIKKYIAIDDLDLIKWIPDNFIHVPQENLGIKQIGISEKIINMYKKFEEL